MFELNVTIKNKTDQTQEVRKYTGDTGGNLGFNLHRDVAISEQEEDGRIYIVKQSDLPTDVGFQRTLNFKLKRRTNFFIES